MDDQCSIMSSVYWDATSQDCGGMAESFSEFDDFETPKGSLTDLVISTNKHIDVDVDDISSNNDQDSVKFMNEKLEVTLGTQVDQTDDCCENSDHHSDSSQLSQPKIESRTFISESYVPEETISDTKSQNSDTNDLPKDFPIRPPMKKQLSVTTKSQNSNRTSWTQNIKRRWSQTKSKLQKSLSVQHVDSNNDQNSKKKGSAILVKMRNSFRKIKMNSKLSNKPSADQPYNNNNHIIDSESTSGVLGSDAGYFNFEELDGPQKDVSSLVRTPSKPPRVLDIASFITTDQQFFTNCPSPRLRLSGWHSPSPTPSFVRTGSHNHHHMSQNISSSLLNLMCSSLRRLDQLVALTNQSDAPITETNNQDDVKLFKSLLATFLYIARLQIQSSKQRIDQSLARHIDFHDNKSELSCKSQKYSIDAIKEFQKNQLVFITNNSNKRIFIALNPSQQSQATKQNTNSYFVIDRLSLDEYQEPISEWQIYPASLIINMAQEMSRVMNYPKTTSSTHETTNLHPLTSLLISTIYKIINSLVNQPNSRPIQPSDITLVLSDISLVVIYSPSQSSNNILSSNNYNKMAFGSLSIQLSDISSTTINILNQLHNRPLLISALYPIDYLFYLIILHTYS